MTHPNAETVAAALESLPRADQLKVAVEAIESLIATMELEDWKLDWRFDCIVKVLKADLETRPQ